MSKRPATPDELQDASLLASRRPKPVPTTSLPSDRQREILQQKWDDQLKSKPELNLGGSTLGTNKGGLNLASINNANLENNQFTYITQLSGEDDPTPRIYEWLRNSPEGRLNEIFGGRHQKLRDDYMAETGSDFLESTELTAWMNEGLDPGGMFNEHRFLLWCYGEAGVGKSTLFSQVAHRLRSRDATHNNQCVIYLHCDFAQKHAFNHENLLKWALMQAMQQIREQTNKTPISLVEAWRQNQITSDGFGSIHPTDAHDLLTKLVKEFDRCFILIDGLDEYVDDAAKRESYAGNGTGLLRSLYGVGRDCKGRCRMLITSRPPCMHAHTYDVNRVSYHMVSAKNDMRKYIADKLKSYDLKDRLEHPVSHDLRDMISKTLEESPSFLILKLRWLQINEMKSLKQVRKSIKELPNNLHAIYKKEWDRVQSQGDDDRDIAKKIIGIVFHARRVLSLEELAQAMATEVDDEQFDPENMMAYDDHIAHTMAFLTFEPHKPNLAQPAAIQVRFYHLTARQFLQSEIDTDEVLSKTEERLARICITQLKFKDFEHACSMEELQQRRKELPFWGYSAQWAGSHICSWLRTNPGQATEVKSTIDADIPLGSWQVLAAKVLQYPEAPRIPLWLGKLTALQKYIVLDADFIVHDMLSGAESGSLLESRGFKDETPLHTAARVGSFACVKVLLEHGADVNTKNASGKNALDMIMLKPWQQYNHGTTISDDQFLIALLLLRFVHEGAKKTRLDDDLRNDLNEGTADPFSAERLRKENEGHKRMTRLVLGSGMKLNISENETKIVDLLLEKNIELNNTKGTEATALQLATVYGREDLVVELLKKGANPFLKKALGYTALEIAEEKGLDETVEALRTRMSELDLLEESEPDDTAKRGHHGRTEADEIDRSGMEDRYRIFDNIPIHVRIEIGPDTKQEST